MRIATWNVNSLRVRLPQLLEWLAGARPDVVALQETKLTDDAFPGGELRAAGYHSVCRPAWKLRVAISCRCLETGIGSPVLTCALTRARTSGSQA